MAPPNLPKRPLLATKWAKNGVFVRVLRGWGSKSPLFESKRSTFLGSQPPPQLILATSLYAVQKYPLGEVFTILWEENRRLPFTDTKLLKDLRFTFIRTEWKSNTDTVKITLLFHYRSLLWSLCIKILSCILWRHIQYISSKLLTNFLC